MPPTTIKDFDWRHWFFLVLDMKHKNNDSRAKSPRGGPTVCTVLLYRVIQQKFPPFFLQ